MADTPTLQVQTETRGSVPKGAASFAAHRVSELLHVAPEPVLFARVTLTMSADPAVERPAIVEANVDLNGRLVRAQAAAPTIGEAVGLACERLRVRLERAARNWEAVRGSRPVAEPGEWRHQGLPADRPGHRGRPPQERSVVRRTSYAPVRETPDEAAVDAELLDYDFHLFTETSTGQDGVIYRTPHGYGLALADPANGGLGPVDPSIAVSAEPAPRLTVADATARLEAMSLAFLFFVDEQTGRGNVLYRRYDGNYGLVIPAG